MIVDTNATTSGNKVAWNCIEVSRNNYLCWGYATVPVALNTVKEVTVTLPVSDVNSGNGLFPVITRLSGGSGWADVEMIVPAEHRTANSFRVQSWIQSGSYSGPSSINFSWMCVVMTA